jgi:prophage maintenance system killer protein
VNKRVAVTTVAAFLKVNGYALGFADLDAYRFLIALYQTGCMRFAELDTLAAGAHGSGE